MNITTGTILISAASLDDPAFDKVIIFITEYNEKGAVGFVINKLFSRTLNELVEFKTARYFPLYEGGPMENESLYFIHQRPDLIEDATCIIDTIYLGGNFQQAITYINQTAINKNDIKLLIGYCGWDPGQLEDEIEEGSWKICDISLQIIFSDNADKLWDLLRK